MKIYLRLLDKLPSFGYNQSIPVFLGDVYNCVGECKVFSDTKGRHFGELILNQDIPEDYYLYYRISATEASVFFLTELLFLESVKEADTPKLRDCIV